MKIGKLFRSRYWTHRKYIVEIFSHNEIRLLMIFQYWQMQFDHFFHWQLNQNVEIENMKIDIFPYHKICFEEFDQYECSEKKFSPEKKMSTLISKKKNNFEGIQKQTHLIIFKNLFLFSYIPFHILVTETEKKWIRKKDRKWNPLLFIIHFTISFSRNRTKSYAHPVHK